MDWPWNWDASMWAIVALWLIVILAAYDAFVWTVAAVRQGQTQTDAEHFHEWTEEQIGSLNARLDRVGAPGPHPSSPAPRPMRPVPVDDITEVLPAVPSITDVAASTDRAVAQLRAAAGLPAEGPVTRAMPAVRTVPPPVPVARHAADQPTTAQQAAPTRPDFRAMPAADPLTPAFVQPGQGAPEPAGRHRAPDADE